MWGYAGIASLIIVLMALFAFLRNLQKRRARDVLESQAGKKIWAMSSGASFFGQKSRGLAQVRGNGVLVLNDDGVYFEMWAPRKKLLIPYRNVLTVEKVRSFMGKSCLRPLLKIVFVNDEGKPDAAGWYVKHVDRYLTIIENLRSKS